MAFCGACGAVPATFPMSMIFINIQDHIFADAIMIGRLPATTITFISFAIGGTMALFFTDQSNISLLAKISAMLSSVGFIPWILLPMGYPPDFWCELFLWQELADV